MSEAEFPLQPDPRWKNVFLINLSSYTRNDSYVPTANVKIFRGCKVNFAGRLCSFFKYYVDTITPILSSLAVIHIIRILKVDPTP